MIASDFCKSTITLPYSDLLTIPLKISPTLSLNSSNCLSLSASLIWCDITCFAVCAAIRPKSTGGNSSLTISSILASLFFSSASSNPISEWVFMTFSTTFNFLPSSIFPVALSITT